MSFWLVLGIIAWVIIAFWPAQWAKNKGYSFFLFLILSWFVSFVLTLIIVALLRNKNETPRERADSQAVEEILDSETPTVK
ncbi:MAG: hypothetical protein WAQ27_04625 [Candidatus Microsaccharimonas sp.]